MPKEEVKTTQIQMQLKGMERTKTKSVVALMSGGVESTAVCKKLKDDGFKIIGLWINYGQPAAEAELSCLKKQHEMRLMDQFFPLNLNLPFWRIPKKAELDEEGWIPGRNTLFLVLAGILAETLNADGIAIGFMKEDIGVFGDNNLTHHKMIEALVTESMSREIIVFLPISNMSKRELIKYVKGIPTVSCWFPKIIREEIIPCRNCPNCKERIKYEIM